MDKIRLQNLITGEYLATKKKVHKVSSFMHDHFYRHHMHRDRDENLGKFAEEVHLIGRKARMDQIGKN